MDAFDYNLAVCVLRNPNGLDFGEAMRSLNLHTEEMHLNDEPNKPKLEWVRQFLLVNWQKSRNSQSSTQFCLSKNNIKLFSSKPIPHLNEKNKGYYYTQAKDAEEELKSEEKQEDNCK